MDNVAVIEAAKDMEDGIRFTNICKKLVSKAFSLACSLDKSSNVNYVDRGRNYALGLAHVGKDLQPLVRYIGGSQVGFYRTEGEIGALGFSGTDAIEQG